jgi:hypothetical protein
MQNMSQETERRKMMEITVKIADNTLLSSAEEAARKAVALAFHSPQYREDKGGAGWEIVSQQVQAYVLTLDVRPQIEALAQKALANVVSRALELEIEKMVKKTTKRMTLDGTLFPKSDGV